MSPTPTRAVQTAVEKLLAAQDRWHHGTGPMLQENEATRILIAAVAQARREGYSKGRRAALKQKGG